MNLFPVLRVASDSLAEDSDTICKFLLIEVEHAVTTSATLAVLYRFSHKQ
jgi:hypothetical protein